jgi:glycerophosphoryl diester phosphodiesterase
MASEAQLVIAHRGSSGYLPEHTLPAKAMAYAQSADFIEQDLVMTADDELVVFHDLVLDAVTNVHTVYPGRSRDDGRYYVIDFTLDELRDLEISERFSRVDGHIVPEYPQRFPPGLSRFRMHTFAEEIELLQGLNHSTGRKVGIYPEIKAPRFHREEGKDISVAVLRVLSRYGYESHDQLVFLQCFDPAELKRIHDELLPEAQMKLPLVQLIGTEAEFTPLLSEEGMAHISGYATGIGPSMHLLVDPASSAEEVKRTGVLARAHAAGLKVHPYTFRRDAGQIPTYARDFDHLLEIFFDDLGVDGVFTDFPDQVARFVQARK